LKHLGWILGLAVGLLLAESSAVAAFIFRAGDSVWVDGKKYSWEEWKKIRDDPELAKQSESAPAPKAEPANPAAGEARAATCATAIYHDEFPSDDEQFQCTRQQILEKGWKVDLIEKIPPPSGQQVQSPRGLPLYSYKLVISR
jgi:hypothetical protein